jgi:Tol biopolymer transport system component
MTRNPRRVHPGILFALAGSALLHLTGELDASSSPIPLLPLDPTRPAPPVSAQHAAAPVVSADGRHIAFVSTQPNLTPHAPNGMPNIYLRDRLEESTTLVSVGWDRHPADGACDAPALSADGRFVLFRSTARNLTPTGGNGWEQLYLRDLLDQRTELISASPDGRASSGPASEARMTADGRFIVFTSPASDLVDHDANATFDVFLHDRATGRNLLISARANRDGTGSHASRNPSVTPDGRFVVFESLSPDLVENDGNTSSDVFRHDTLGGITVLVSVTLASQAAGGSRNARVSADGRWVTFESTAREIAVTDTDRDRSDVFLRDVESGSTIHLSLGSEFDEYSTGARNAQLSQDGALVVFENGPFSLYAWSAELAAPVMLTPAFDGPLSASGYVIDAQISTDSRFVTFASNSTNIVANATAGTFQIYRHALQTGHTDLVSLNQDGQPAQLDCSGPSTTDGLVIAFSSLDPQLVPDDGNAARDVFVRDMTHAVCQRISEELPDNPSVTPPGWTSVTSAALSADAQRVVFTSTADQLVPGDNNGLPDVFLRDLRTGSLELVSVSTNLNSGNRTSGQAVLSRDGRFVAFLSQATDLTTDGTNGVAQLYLRDLEAATTTLVSRTHSGAPSTIPPANFVISADGRFITYESTDPKLFPIDSNSAADVYQYDRLTGLNSLVSVNLDGNRTGLGYSGNPLTTADARTVIFRSRARNLATNLPPATGLHLYARNLVTGITMAHLTPTPLDAGPTSFLSPLALGADGQLIALGLTTGVMVYDLVSHAPASPIRAGRNPVLNDSGRFLAFEQFDTAGLPQVWVWDRVLDAMVLASPNHHNTGGGNAASQTPLLTPSGRFVLFTSQASDLVPTDTRGVRNLFQRDLLLGRTTLLSHTPGGTGGNCYSTHPVLGPDGQTLLFESAASDLIHDDRNLATDVFLLRIGAFDSDADGMDDDWELVHFGDLSRDGSGDWDQDGVTDLEEFQLGTDPRASSRHLTTRTLTRLTDGQSTVVWDSSPGRTYQVQYRDTLEPGPWHSLPDPVTATGFISHLTVESPAPNRFYRVALLVP